MIAINLLLTSIYTIINFSYEHNNFELAQKHNYFSYANTNNNFEYNYKFAENLYDNNYIFNETMITVLTHGMGGNLNYWFPKDEANNYSPLYYDEESLPYKILSTMTVDTYNLPIISFEPRINNNEIYNVTLKQLIIDENSEYTFRYLNVDNYEQFEGIFSKHIVLIYNGESVNEFAGESNAFVSKIFKKSLDATLATFSPFYGGNLPKINLIGHSRGGILNLYYAAQRKNIVSNLISIGTPYNGTSWGDGLQSLMKVIECVIGEERPDFSGILGESNSRINEELLSDLDDVYKVAIGCDVTPDVFCTQIINALTKNDFENLADLQFGNDNFVIQIINEFIEKLSSSDLLIGEAVKFAARMVRKLSRKFEANLQVINILNEIFDILEIVTINENEIDLEILFSYCVDFLEKIITLCNEIIDFDDRGCVQTDFCVDLKSQFAEKNGHNLFDRKIHIPFGLENNIIFEDKYLSNPDMPKVAHNYESNYPTITDSIVNILRQRNAIHRHNFNHIGHVCSCGFSFESELNISPYRIPFYYLDQNTLSSLYNADMIIQGYELNLREQYYFESQLNREDGYSYYTTSYLDDVTINIQRLRAGYIRNEKITLSPNRTGAGFAYIQFGFNRGVYNFSFDVSLWSDDESVDNSNLKLVYTTDGSFREYLINYMYEDYNFEHNLYSQTLRGQQALLNDVELFQQYYTEIPIHLLPTNRDEPITYHINESDFTYIGFFAACNPTTSTKNKGRICISNLTFNFCEL